MKGKSFLKKIAAAATTVAMLASVSVVGFAAGTVTEGTVGGTGLANKVNANSIAMTEVKSGDTVTGFTFTVNHSFGASKEESAKTIGYTMLAYKGVFSDTGYSGDGSNVVGIAQQTSATDDFEFTVAKAATAGTATRDLTYGDTMVVLLSSDDADGAVGYLYTLKAVAPAAQYAGSTVDVTVPYDADATAILTAVQGVVTGDITVDLGTGAGDAFNALEEDVTATVKEVTAVADNKATVVIEAAEGSAYKTETDTTISVPLNIQKEAWTADTATYAEKVLVDPTINTVAGMTTAVKVALAGKSVTLNDAEKGYTYAYALQSADIESVEISGTHEDSEVVENATFTYNVTVPAETYDDGLVTVGEGGIEADIIVEVKADTRYEADSAKAFKGEDEVTAIVNYSLTEGATVPVAELLTYVQGKIDTYKVYDDADTPNEGAATATWKLYTDEEATTEATGNITETTYYAVATVTPSDTENWKSTTVTLKFAVVVTEAPAYACGDVNHDGKVNNKDAVAIMDYVDGKTEGFYLEQADTLKDDRVNNKDAVTIMDFVDHVYDSLPVVK